MKPELLVFGSKSFNSTFYEIKENLDYSLVFFDFNKPTFNIFSSISGILADDKIFNNKANLNIITKFKKKPIILLQNTHIYVTNNFDNKILLPVSLSELRIKIRNVIAASEFITNSSLKIKDYFLNKNEKKLTKFDINISLTDREVQLIELLFNEKKYLSKDFILEKIWKYFFPQ